MNMDDKEISALAIGNATEAWDQRFAYANSKASYFVNVIDTLKVNGCYSPHSVLVGTEAYLAQYNKLYNDHLFRGTA
jgi:hypothetical protein